MYIGSAGGANATETTNCANEAAGMASIRSASNNKRMVRILITLPDHPSIARLTLLLRAAWIEEATYAKDPTDAVSRSEHYGSPFVNVASHHPHDLYGTEPFIAKRGGGAGRLSGRPGQARRLESVAPEHESTGSSLIGLRVSKAASFRMDCTISVLLLGMPPAAGVMRGLRSLDVQQKGPSALDPSLKYSVLL